MNFKRKLVSFSVFGSIGLVSEITFTSITETFKSIGTPEFNLRLMGHTYLWMFPIYGLVSFIGPLLFNKIINFNIAIRALIYVACIYTIEFSSGFFLEQITGICPWKYSEGWHLFGYIRIDYFPFWALFGLMIEKIFIFTNSVLDKYYS